MENLLRDRDEGITRARAIVEELEKEHEELKLKKEKLENEILVRTARDFKSAWKVMKDIQQKVNGFEGSMKMFGDQMKYITTIFEKLETEELQNRMDKLHWINDESTTLIILSNAMYLLCGLRSSWKFLDLEPPVAHEHGGAVCLNDEIYIFGGDVLKNRVCKLNHQMKWIQMPTMNERRTFISNSSLVYDDCIWVFGGRNPSPNDQIGTAMNSVEKYEPNQKKWIRMPPMKEQRADASAAACADKIFVCGGTDGEKAFKSVECIHLKENVWTMFVDLPEPRSGHAMISHGNSLLVLGGRNEGEDFATVWKINSNGTSAVWNELPSMSESRYYLSAVVLKDEIYAIGGDEAGSVEIFNGETWERGPELSEELQAVSALVVRPHVAATLS